MTDKPMLDSEATTAGAIRQSVDRAIEKSTCPLCGADYAMDTPYKVRFTCGTFMSPLRKQFDSERGDVQSKACRLRRQLDEAQERERELRDLLTVHERQQAEYMAHNAQLRRLLERQSDAMGAYQLHLAECEDCFMGDPCLEEHRLFAAMSDVDREVVAVLADAPANPLAHFTDGQLYEELGRRGWKAATWAQEEAVTCDS